ncbi:MAG: hypothetical protein KKG75_01590 [Nanoarchaeota archaeon]|nr:hypothetical protein [Nanoarchaeota archaeon]
MKVYNRNGKPVETSVEEAQRIQDARAAHERKVRELCALIDTENNYVHINTTSGPIGGRVVGYDGENIRVVEDPNMPARVTAFSKHTYTGFERINRNGNPVE